MCPIVELEPGADDYPYLQQGGKYGPGLDHEADCEVVLYEFPSSEDRKIFGKLHPADEICHLRIQVRSEEFGTSTLFITEPIVSNSGSKWPQWLTQLGVDNSGPPSYQHDSDDVEGRKCWVEVTDPRQDQSTGRWYNGNVRDMGAV